MNRLINETSPYLLQHAHNPVDWYPWGEEALQKAQTENKPIIVSIGYSACHWCHVMERESFENEALAELMNRHYVCIKIDREERPDVDAVYMDALHAMGLRGGWPLNVFLMPNGKPFYGGTYFPPVQRGQHPGWREVLIGVANAFADPENRQKLYDSAEGFTQNMLFSESEKYGLTATDEYLNEQDLIGMYERIAQRFDNVWGGSGAAPKFPMPCRYEFLMRYIAISKNQDALQHLQLTLDCMALGGIYDQLGGGFARYSTDDEWLAPHFEKMLYDNAQLLSVYAQGYALTKNPLYKDVAEQTVTWIEREMTSSEGGFYSALDADSEGVEGKFYTWSKKEIEEILSEDAHDFCRIYQVSEHGNWEETNILWRNRKYQLTNSEQEKLKSWHTQLMAVRETRIRPGLDDKVLASWNGLTIKGLVEVSRTLANEKALQLAIQNGQFLFEKMCYQPANSLHLCLWHSYKNSEAKITGYLEDYAAVIEGFTMLYQVTFDEEWLHRAEKLALYVYENFWDENDQFFFFTDGNSEKLIARKKEVFDNVIPASNSMMARNYYTLGLLLDRDDFINIAQLMLGKVKKLLLTDPDYLCNWAALATDMANTTAEVAFIGADAQALRQEFDQYFTPNKVILGTTKGSTLPLLANRKPQDKSLIYVCYNKTCQMPVETVKEAVEMIK